MDVNRLKHQVKDVLQTKKYTVVFDDVWQRNAIHMAFPRNYLGSRVVITTRNLELSEAASRTETGGFVYSLRHLPVKEAMRLFCRKAFLGAISCPKHLEEICSKILLACEGLPLAIEVIGSILATRGQMKEEWDLLYRSLGAEMESNSQLDNMMKLLSLSYYDLPNHLKNCFLYLSIFPEDQIIYKYKLVRLWIAEGFIERKNGMTLEENAQRYLNELVHRCLVQVANIENGGNIQTIRVHDIIRHILLLKASEQNFTTIFNGGEGMNLQNNVRRLVVHGSINENLGQAQSNCKSLRTLVLFKRVGGNISEEFLSHSRKLVKVLDLTDAELEEIPDEIFKLFNLKYLSLENTKVKSVPKSIGMLQCLQALNLYGTGVTELPVEIQKLQHLRQRSHPKQTLETFEKTQGVRVSFKIGKLKSLQTLYLIEVDEVDNIRTVTEVGKLLQLKELGISKLKREDGHELCSSLGNLTQLCKLFIYSFGEEEVIDFQFINSSYLPPLQVLSLDKYPEWISSLHGLTKIDLRYSKLRDDPLECLHDLPNLIALYLVSAYEGERLCFKSGGFHKLKNLSVIRLQELRWMTVEENAMPSLQDLRIRYCQSMKDIPTGIEYLKRLRYIDFKNMSNEFMEKLGNLDKETAAYEKLVENPIVVRKTYTDGGRSEVHH